MVTNLKFNNKMSKFFLLCVLLINVCYATPPNCLELHQSQLASLNERMNQMISALQSSPILSKLISTTNLSKASSVIPCNEVEDPPPTYQTPHYPSPLTYAAPAPNVIYVPPPSVAPAALASPISSPPSLYYSQLQEHHYPNIPRSAPAPTLSNYYDSYPYYIPSHNPPTTQHRLAPYPPTHYPYPSLPPYEYSYSPKPDYPLPPIYPHSAPYHLPSAPFLPSSYSLPGSYYSPPPPYPIPLDVPPPYHYI